MSTKLPPETEAAFGLTPVLLNVRVVVANPEDELPPQAASQSKPMTAPDIDFLKPIIRMSFQTRAMSAFVFIF